MALLAWLCSHLNGLEIQLVLRVCRLQRQRIARQLEKEIEDLCGMHFKVVPIAPIDAYMQGGGSGGVPFCLLQVQMLPGRRLSVHFSGWPRGHGVGGPASLAFGTSNDQYDYQDAWA